MSQMDRVLAGWAADRAELETLRASLAEARAFASTWRGIALGETGGTAASRMNQFPWELDDQPQSKMVYDPASGAEYPSMRMGDTTPGAI